MRGRKYLSMLCCFLWILVSHVCLVRSENQQLQNNMGVFILAGQSNMAGRGGVTIDRTDGKGTWDGVIPQECNPNPSIFRLSAELQWVEAHEPLHADIDVRRANGIGPGMSFANSVLSKDSTFGNLGLVPCAIGGTNISEWKRGKFLYKQMMRRAQASLQNGGTIRALLWYQGEADTKNREDANLYKGRLEKFFSDVRDDLQSPMLPIIQVALASGVGSYIDIVRKAQLEIDLLNLRTVDAKGLPLEPDGLHLTSSAQVRVGQMMADAFLQFEHIPTSNQAISSNALATLSHSISREPSYDSPFVLLRNLLIRNLQKSGCSLSESEAWAETLNSSLSSLKRKGGFWNRPQSTAV